MAGLRAGMAANRASGLAPTTVTLGTLDDDFLTIVQQHFFFPGVSTEFIYLCTRDHAYPQSQCQSNSSHYAQQTMSMIHAYFLQNEFP